MSELPLGAVDRLIRKNGFKRVKIETAKALRDVLEDISNEIILTAGQLVKNRNQQVLNANDIKFAFDIVKSKWK